MREIVQKTEHVPERVPQRFEQKNFVNYDEQMRRHEFGMELEGRAEVAAVTEQERSQFFERMLRVNPSVAECLVMNRRRSDLQAREENNDYVLEQMERAEKEGQNSSLYEQNESQLVDLKQHNLIPEDAQAIVEMYQLREYCILHLAWTRLQQSQPLNEDKKRFYAAVGTLVISLFKILQ